MKATPSASRLRASAARTAFASYSVSTEPLWRPNLEAITYSEREAPDARSASPSARSARWSASADRDMRSVSTVQRADVASLSRACKLTRLSRVEEVDATLESGTDDGVDRGLAALDVAVRRVWLLLSAAE
eukprot:919300-Prymnesium_polylepis.1